MEIRTDLAMEHSIFSEGGPLPRGVSIRRTDKGGVGATVVEITGSRAARLLGRPKGKYVTLELDGLLRREKDAFPAAVKSLAGWLRELLDLPEFLPVLVAGLGNREVTPDAVGPLTADHILVTRHMLRQMPREFGDFRPVSVVVPGVLGTTGVESAETVRALAERTGAAAVVAVDAIAARDTGKLCTTVQLSTAGIAPGSGIGNHRQALERETLGVPVIAIGVPTITDAAAMAADLLARAGTPADEDRLHRVSTGMMVTCCDIDRRIRELSRALAYGINLGLQPRLGLADLEDLTF